MINSNSMNGAWILPDGSIHYTNNIQSHSKVIDELNIKNKLIANKTIFLTNDLAQIALKLGYIRITCYNNSFGIEIDNISKIQLNSIIIVCNELYDYNNINENWLIELNDGIFKQFTSKNATYQFLKSLAN